MKKIIILTMALMLCLFVITGCGSGSDKSDTDSTEAADTADDTSESEDGAGDDVANDVGDVIDDVADGAGDIVDDAAGTVDDVTDDMTDAITGSYETYDDAYNYFMSMLPADSGNYEVRNSDKDLTEYDTGRQGYHFELHDSSKTDETKLGDFYVDSETGKVYLQDESDGSVSEYDMSELS